MTACFAPQICDNKVIARWKARLARTFSPSRAADFRDAFGLACGMCAIGDTTNGYLILDELSSFNFAGDYDKWLYVFAAKTATGKHLQNKDTTNPNWIDAQRAVGEVSIAKGIRSALRNCPPPCMGERHDVTALSNVVAQTWYFEGLGYSKLEEIALAELRAGILEQLRPYFTVKGTQGSE